MVGSNGKKPSGNGKKTNGKKNGPAPSGPSTESRLRIKSAAKMRIEGAAWAVIAKNFGYKNEHTALDFLARRYPKRWKKEFEEAEELYGETIDAEALLTQRELMRPYRVDVNPSTGAKKTISNDPRVRSGAAHSLLHHRRALKQMKLKTEGDVNVTVPVHVSTGEGEEAQGGERSAIDRLYDRLEKRFTPEE